MSSGLKLWHTYEVEDDAAIAEVTGGAVEGLVVGGQKGGVAAVFAVDKAHVASVR